MEGGVKGMSVSRYQKGLLAGIVLCGVFAFTMGYFTGFEPAWRTIRDGMTQSQVTQALGPPTTVGTSGCLGAGSKEVVRWDYRRSFFGGSMHHYVDFDFIGANGAPAVFRTERSREAWTWPFWSPWQRAKARA